MPGGRQGPQGFQYGAPQGFMNDPRGPQGGAGPQGPGGRGGPWGGPRTPGAGPGGMMMNQRGPPGVRLFVVCFWLIAPPTCCYIDPIDNMYQSFVLVRARENVCFYDGWNTLLPS